MDITPPEARAVYDTVMARIEALMPADPGDDTSQGKELILLVGLAMFYERDIFPGEPNVKAAQAVRSLNPLRWFLPRKHK
jgi:hypothetical protein